MSFSKFDNYAQKVAANASSPGLSKTGKDVTSLFTSPTKSPSRPSEHVINIQPIVMKDDNGIWQVVCIVMNKTYPLNEFMKGAFKIPGEIGTWIRGRLLFISKHLPELLQSSGMNEQHFAFLRAGTTDALPRFFWSSLVKGMLYILHLSTCLFIS